MKNVEIFKLAVLNELENLLCSRQIKIIVLDETVSTSTYLLDLIKEEYCDNVAVIAFRQSGGRGRSGRIWHSDNANNLYISIAVNVSGDLSEIFPMVPLAAGVSIAKVLTGFGYKHLKLKWPNDLLFNGRKVAGILCETPGLKKNSAIGVIGMGVNFSENRFPDDIAEIAAELADMKNIPLPSRESVSARWIIEVLSHIESLESGNTEKLVNEWKSFGEPFGRKVQTGGVKGTTVDLARSGRLIIKTETGEQFEIPGGIVEYID
ncbi:MAG: biotin--[acetyl-CoA-carboxylase] ligase [Deltaproteobacteria bacterium]|nr:biotin--[acetyl-CoA-carboxylase] ligase [Deltaproteobacteria bacterium]